MRKEVANRLHELMSENDDIILLVGDLGFGLFDKIRDDFPERFYNVGAAETALLDIGIGLALSGKKPICYSITPFLLYRAFESIRTYIDHESIPVVLLGSGRDDSYLHDGFSHDASDDHLFMNHFKNIKSFWPPDNKQACEVLEEAVNGSAPVYLNLTR